MGSFSNYYKRNEIYICYKGEEIVAQGNLGEIAKKLNTQVRNLKYNLTNAYKRKLEKAPKNTKRRVLVKV